MKTASLLQVKTASSIWQNAVKSVSRLTGLFVRVIPLIVGSSSTSWVKASIVFARFAVALTKSQGQRGLAIYLKAANLILIRSVSGKRLLNSRDGGMAVAVSHGGLPRLIPASHRARIKGGDISVIRLWLGLFTLYRVLAFRGRLSIKTIISPGVEIPESLMLSWRGFVNGTFIRWIGQFGVSRFATKLYYDSDKTGQPEEKPYPDFREVYGSTQDWHRTYWVISDLARHIRRLVITKSGPNSLKGSTSISNVLRDAEAWLSRPSLLMMLRGLAIISGCNHLLSGPIWDSAAISWNETLKFREAIHSGKAENPFGKDAPIATNPSGDLGALGTREEPGKIRLFAMVDIFTQWVLSPLHHALFGILRKIPQDGTFDQIKPVKELIKRCENKGVRQVYSYDLSAATDRLPVVLQEWLLAAFTGRAYAESWRAVLCDRWYRLPQIFSKTFGPRAFSSLDGGSPKGGLSFKNARVKYAVGQPMGALSSWAMLAMTHHAIVQFAAYRMGWRSWFTDYAVLGDDIVIANSNVATEYVKIMKEIGVDIGFHKSVISNNLSLEFAKRFFYKGKEVTPFPLVGAAVGFLGDSFVPEVIRECESLTGSSTSVFRIARYLGVGMRAASAAGNRLFSRLPRKLRAVLLLITRPNSVRPVGSTWQWLTSASYGNKKYRSATVKGRDSVQKSLLSYLSTSFLPRLEKRFASILSEFKLELNIPHPPKGDMLKRCETWWHDYIIEDLQSTFDWDFGEVRLMMSKIDRTVLPSEKEINGLLEACEQVEKVAASIPIKVLSKKSESPNKEAKKPAREPRWVKMWRTLNKSMIDAPLVQRGSTCSM
jgi:hypothetical protein